MGRIAPACLTALLALAFAGGAASANAATCPNEALREAQSATGMPGCMALEMASPPQKFGQPAYLPSFSRDGERLAFTSEAALAGTPRLQNYGGDRYLASRGASGWVTSPTAAPGSAGIVAGGPRVGNPSIFTPSLDRWAQFGATQAQAQVGVARLFTNGLGAPFELLSPLLVPTEDNITNELQISVNFLELDGASPDLATSVLRVKSPAIAYLPGDPRSISAEPAPGGDRNSYVVSSEGGEPELELLARDKDGVVHGGRCGAHLGGERATFNQGAISPDGQRIFLSTRPAQPFDEETAAGPACETAKPLRVLQRTATPEGPVIAEIAPGAPAASGDDLFQGASADGTKAYFTSPRDIAASDADPSPEACGAEVGKSKGCDLYLYDSSKPPAERLTQASAGQDASPGEGADVLSGATAISGDGSRAYFVAQGALTGEPNPAGDSAQAGEPNLYLYGAETESLAFIATLSPADAGGMWGTKGTGFGDAYAAPLYGPGLQGGGDGRILAFASKAPLTSDDEDGGFRDVFRYDADAGTLERISKAAEGGSDNGAFDAAVNPAVEGVAEYNFGEMVRWASEDGQVIAFATEEALIPGDEDAADNPYAWHSGELGAVLAPIEESPAVGPVGAQLAFSTPAALLSQDIDTSPDVYVARANGGFPLPADPQECDPLQEGSCGQASPAPQAPGPPASAGFSGPGNARAPVVRCRKPLVKRRGKCIRKARKGKARKEAGRRQGGRR